MAEFYRSRHRRRVSSVWFAFALNLFFASVVYSVSAHSFDRTLFRTHEASGGLFYLVKIAGANFKVEDFTAEAGGYVTLDIRVPPRWQDADGAEVKPGFLMFQGMPNGFELSKGFKAGKAWAVDFDDILSIRLQPTSGFTGDVVISVRVHAVGGKIISETSFSAVFGIDARDVKTSANTETRLGEARPVLSEPVAKISIEAQAHLLKKAEEHQASGLIAAARLLYKKLADQGNARAAYALAQTYDPEILKSRTIVGLRPDIGQARKWYKIALEMGLASAGTRLIALSPGR